MKSPPVTLAPASFHGINSARVILKHHGKSFDFAGKFLSGQSLGRCARLYQFCRFLDDLSDESDDPGLAAQQLEKVETDLLQGNLRHPAVADFLELAQECDLDLTSAVELLRGVKSDLTSVAMRSEAELKQYAYRVAGTVGLMMCEVLGVKSPAAFRHAIDLGVAMQLTNIARDVREDAQIGRRYLPADLFDRVPDIKSLAAGDSETHHDTRKAVLWLLEEADRYYTSGIAGLAYLPLRARPGVLIAARLYQSIGTRIRQMDFAVWEGRAMVSFWKKALIAARTFGYFCLHGGLRKIPPRHEASLHRFFAELPRAHAPHEGTSAP